MDAVDRIDALFDRTSGRSSPETRTLRDVHLTPPAVTITVLLATTTMLTNHVKGGVAAFTGHMVDAPGRDEPRFPLNKVESVRREIARALEAYDVRHGFSSAARGSDILFLEELLKRGGTAHIFLPFPARAFAQTSVGYGWDGRVWPKRMPDAKLIEDVLIGRRNICHDEIGVKNLLIHRLINNPGMNNLVSPYTGEARVFDRPTRPRSW